MSDSVSYNAGWEMGRKQGLREAADDIERLRAALAIAADRLAYLGCPDEAAEIRRVLEGEWDERKSD